MKKLTALVITIMLIITSVPMISATSVSDVAQTAVEPQTTDDYPIITSISTANNGVKITWDKYDNNSKYRLFYKTATSWKTITTTNSLSYTHTGLSNNQTYIYTVRMVDGNGAFTSNYNKEGWAHTYLQSPVMKSLSCTTEGMKVTWNAVDGAENYKVYVKKSTGSWIALGYTTGTSFVDKNVVSSNSYTYTVRCVTKDGKTFTSYHTSGIKGTYVATPQITKVENTATGTKVTWTKISGASKYRLFYKTATAWKTITNTTSTSYTHAPLNNQATFTYTVRALNNKNEYISSYNSTGTTNTFLSVPHLKSTQSVLGGMKITWNGVLGAQNYKVYVKTSSSWKSLGTTKETSFIDTTATSGKSYTYTIRCVTPDGNTWASYFDTKGITGTYVASPVISKVENLNDSAKITWNKVSGATKYKVFYKTATSWKTIATTDSTTYTHQNLKDGDVYTYTVRACNNSGTYISGYDSTGVTNKFIAPIVLTYKINTNFKPVLSWKAEDSAYRYRIYRKYLDGSWEKLSDVTGTTFTDTNPPQNVPYTYAMRCLDSNSNPISYYVTDTKYYYNGALADGDITYNNTTYKFSDGNLRQGYVTINGKLHYYDKNGKLMKNGIVGTKEEGYYCADENGVCCQSEEMRLAAEFMMNKASGNTLDQRMKTGFNYMAMNFPYFRSYDHPKKASDMPKQAIDMFENEKGNCFKYAAAFACVAKAAGYRSRVVVGTTPGYGTWTPHGWTEVYVNGNWLVSDPDFQMMYPTPAYSYYMKSTHPNAVRVEARYEIEIIDGEAVWK